MKTVNYINRDYVNPVDLQVLGQTFNTLEQGHKEAVKAASDLKATMAKFDLNEAEDEWRQQKINEIKATIDDNIIYGNAAGAYDDLVLQAGNLMSDPALLGRLNAQKDYKQFNEDLKKAAIPEGMKDMYREINPYHYEDKFDKKGNLIGGSKWQPNRTPVSTVPEVKLQEYALKFAAKDAGSGTSVSFIDKNGKETINPAESFDGNIYKKVGTKFERLSSDKIKKAYQMAINSIPGAEDSLHQDFDYERWKYNKIKDDNVNKGKDPNPVVNGYTDKDGNVYSYDKWLENKINKFAQISAYNHVFSDVSYGTAYQNYKANKGQREEKRAAINKEAKVDNQINKGVAYNRIGMVEVESNTFAGLENSYSTANNIGLTLSRKALGKKALSKSNSLNDVMQYFKRIGAGTGPVSIANHIIKHAGNNLSDVEKLQLLNSFSSYVEIGKIRNKVINSSGDNGEGLRFSSDVSNDDFHNNNVYSKRIIESLNDLKYYNPNNISADIDNNVMRNLLEEYGTNIDGLRKLGFIVTNDDSGYHVTISSDNYNRLPRFIDKIKKADDRANYLIPGYNFNLKGQRDGKDIDFIKEINKKYEDGVEAGAKAEVKTGIRKGQIPLFSTDRGSFASQYYNVFGKDLGLTEPQIRELSKDGDEAVDRMLASNLLDSGIIETIDEAGRVTKNIQDAQDAKLLINKMYSNDTYKKNVTRAIMIPRGVSMGQSKGYVLSIDVPTDVAVGKYKANKNYKFIIRGTMEESTNFDPSFNPKTLAENSITTSRGTNSPIENIGYDSDLGNTSITPIGDNKYSTSLMGRPVIINEEEATKLTANIIRIQQIKANAHAGLYDNDDYKAELMAESIKALSYDIAEIIGKDKDDTNALVSSYILKPINE